MPYSASIIAFAFVQKGINEWHFVTQMKLQKMVYFAHGYHLAKYKEPLIKEEFQAWKFGPVVPEIYRAYKLYGSRPITDLQLLYYTPESVDLDAKALDAINYTWELTKKLPAEVLSNWTHRPQSPWSRVYKEADWAIPIKDTSIKEYFENLLTIGV